MATEKERKFRSNLIIGAGKKSTKNSKRRCEIDYELSTLCAIGSQAQTNRLDPLLTLIRNAPQCPLETLHLIEDISKLIKGRDNAWIRASIKKVGHVASI